MEKIKIKISKKIAICKKIYLISSNADYMVTFDFDADWNKETGKVARFIFDENFIDVPFTGNTVLVPKIFPCESLGVSVFAPSISSTAAEIGCVVFAKDFDVRASGGSFRGECE